MRPELSGALASLGIKLAPEWLAACDAHLRAFLTGYDRFTLDKQVEAVYCQFLESDMNLAGAGCLPPNIEARTQLRRSPRRAHPPASPDARKGAAARPLRAADG